MSLRTTSKPFSFLTFVFSNHYDDSGGHTIRKVKCLFFVDRTIDVVECFSIFVPGRQRRLRIQEFLDEIELRTFVENDMEALLNIRFLITEFVIDESNRIYSAEHDPESNSFILIEDKNLIDEGLVDQGFAYRTALLDRNEKLVLLYNGETGEARSCKDFD